MRVTRLLVAAGLVAAAFGSVPANAAQENCATHPENCYQCVMYPCYPSDWPPFLLDKVEELLKGDA